MGEVILVASGKGGVGKTVFAANMGAYLAGEGKRIALVDMNMGLRNLDICLGLENRIVYDVADVLMGLCRIKQALVKDKRFAALYLMSAAQYIDKTPIVPQQMKSLYEKLCQAFDYVIVDAPAGIGEAFMATAHGVDAAVIVTAPEYAAVRDGEMVSGLLLKAGIKKRFCVVNQVREHLFASKLVPDLQEIADTIKLPLAGVIQYDESIHISANNGVPAVIKPGTYIQKNFDEIADRIVNGTD